MGKDENLFEQIGDAVNRLESENKQKNEQNHELLKKMELYCMLQSQVLPDPYDSGSTGLIKVRDKLLKIKQSLDNLKKLKNLENYEDGEPDTQNNEFSTEKATEILNLAWNRVKNPTLIQNIDSTQVNLNCFSSKVELKTSSHKGRHIISKTSIPQGELVIKEKAQSCHLDFKYFNVRCYRVVFSTT